MLLRAWFLCSLLLIAFAYGIGVGRFEWQPFNTISEGWVAGKDWLANREQYTRTSPQKHLHRARHEGSGVTRYSADQAYNGVTLIASMWDEQLGLRLVDMQGEVIHRWDANFNKVFPNASHLRAQPHDWDTAILGMVAFPNGDLVFNFEESGLVAMDACGRTRWSIPDRTHHQVFRAENGNLWVPTLVTHEEKDVSRPLLKAPYRDDVLLEITPDGEIVRRISVLDVLIRSHYDGLLIESPTSVTSDMQWAGISSKRLDIMHLNDIDIVSTELADAFEQFEAGDIMVSLRNLDAVVIIDPDTETVKWVMTGPWLMQHDPDFMPNGNIMVFNNNVRGRHGRGEYTGSQVLEVNPVTRAVSVYYEGNREERFFTELMGRNHLLPNGNVLIVEPHAGRTFEATPEGSIVWEYINRWDEEKVAAITEAERYPANFFQLDNLGCST